MTGPAGSGQRVTSWQYFLARDRRILPVSFHASRLTGRSVSENRENCWKARVTPLSYNVARKGERERLKISGQG